jgi:PhzF family phenazine biosynthesis protein
MKSYTVYQIDAFTKEKFKGNPAGVVLNADGLDEEQMQAIARELNNSETAFLFSPGGDDCDGIIRYFTPGTEVPTCGHATIASLYAMAVEKNLNDTLIRMKTKIGILPSEIKKIENDYKLFMTQGKIEFGNMIEGKLRDRLLSALGISKIEMDKNCPIQIVSTGHSKVMIGIKSISKLNALKPNYSALADLSQIIKCNGYFVFTFDTGTSDILTCGRMFAPAIGINEDPVTGNANGPLGAYLVNHKLVKTNGSEFYFKSLQGEAINRTGIIEVFVKIENNEPVQIKIGGEAVVVFKTFFEL